MIAALSLRTKFPSCEAHQYRWMQCSVPWTKQLTHLQTGDFRKRIDHDKLPAACLTSCNVDIAFLNVESVDPAQQTSYCCHAFHA